MIIKGSYLQVFIAGLLFLKLPQELDEGLRTYLPQQHMGFTAMAYTLMLLTDILYPLAALILVFSSSEKLKNPRIITRFG